MKTNPFANSILVATALLLLTVSCKKDPPQSRKEILTTGKWRTVAQTVSPAIDWDGDGDLDSDLHVITEACIKDDYAIFRADGSVEENEGPSKCDAADPQSEILSWSLKNNDMILVVDGQDFTIEQMSETTMKLKIQEFGVTVSATLQKF